MVLLALSSVGLAEALRLAKHGKASVWCGADVISLEDYKALRGVSVSRFVHSLNGDDKDVLEGALDTMREHHPAETIWIESDGCRRASLEAELRAEQSTLNRYDEVVSCESSSSEGLIFLKVVAQPHGDPIELNTAEARALAERILKAVREVESGWMGSEGRGRGDAV